MRRLIVAARLEPGPMTFRLIRLFAGNVLIMSNGQIHHFVVSGRRNYDDSQFREVFRHRQLRHGIGLSDAKMLAKMTDSGCRAEAPDLRVARHFGENKAHCPVSVRRIDASLWLVVSRNVLRPEKSPSKNIALW